MRTPLTPKLLPRLLFLLLITAAPCQSGVDHLALGKMWTFENPPLAYLKAEYGFEPDQRWFDALRLGALRLGEEGNPWCSASFVSPRGLIMTNHHCVREQVAQVQVGADWVAGGFAAARLEDEVPIPGLIVQQLTAQEDVTARIEVGIGDEDDDVTAQQKRSGNIAAVVAAADAAHPGFVHEVVALHHGATYQLYRYRVFADLRLVVAPHLQIAHFGGDPDNFTYPRWSIDFSFLRAYEDGQPADTAGHYFRWRSGGARDNDLVFVPGNPGNTNRQATVAQLAVQRDVEYPMLLDQLANGMEILRPFRDADPGILTTLLSWENSYKAIGGMLEGLRDADLMARKQAHERQFRSAVYAEPELAARFGRIWSELEELSAASRSLKPKVAFYAPSYSDVLERGLAIAQALDETLDDDQRHAQREAALGMAVAGNVLTQRLLQDHFERATRWLATDDPFLAAVAGEHRTGDEYDWPAALRTLGRSRLTRDRFVRELLDASDAAARWQSSADPGVVAARTLWPLLRAAQRESEAVDSAIAQRNALLGRALHAVFGMNVSPDATMTLRFSEGLVRGYPYNGTLAPWATTFYGLFGRAVEFGNRYPFELPEAWREARDKLDLRGRVCFASTNDIVGGNSGSCVVDRDLRVVGLVFDGNIESLANDFYYTQERARAVSVHTDAIVAALQHVYDLQRIVDELQQAAGD